MALQFSEMSYDIDGGSTVRRAISRTGLKGTLKAATSSHLVKYATSFVQERKDHFGGISIDLIECH